MFKKDNIQPSQSFEERLLNLRLKKSKEKSYLLDAEKTKQKNEQKKKANA